MNKTGDKRPAGGAGGAGKKPASKRPGDKRAAGGAGGAGKKPASKRPGDKRAAGPARRLDALGEFAAIELIRGIVGPPGRDVTAGIGDDAAVYRVAAGRRVLAASDMLVEGVHFELSSTTFEELGHKALAANLSDIAAMGGRPRYYIVALALPAKTAVNDLAGLYRGMERLAGPFGVKAIGGDTCSSSGPAVISVTVLGESGPERPVTRGGARPGDDIYVTGSLGDSAAGLELLKAGAVGRGPGAVGRGPGGGGRGIAGRGLGVTGLKKSGIRNPKSAIGYLVSRHLTPAPRVKAGMLLAKSGLVTSMIDVSDGLAGDLGHILEASGAGAVVYTDELPLSDELTSTAGVKEALEHALHGGEDYELLFTAKPGAGAVKRLSALSKRAGVGFTRIGRVTKGKAAYLAAGTGKKKLLRPKGYEHFKR